MTAADYAARARSLAAVAADPDASPKPWGAAHVREAHACLLEAAAAATRRGAYKDAESVADTALRDATSEARFLDALGYVDVRGEDAKRALRRVRGLAEGRLVRAVTWRGQSGEEYADRAPAAADKNHGGSPLTRVTRVRRT